MSALIRTDYKPRDILSWFELTAKERAEFNYLDTEERQSEARFVRYRRWVYNLQEFMCCHPDLKPWHGYASDSYFSGIVIKFVDDNERVICGTYIS